MKLDKVSKGKAKSFATGGRTKMFGAGTRSKTKYPAEPQRPGRTGQHSTKPALKRTGAEVADTAGDMGGTGGVSNPRRPAA